MFVAKKNPKISIIIPTYYRANYVIETIESVQKQTYQNWELIIIDDGSNDNTGGSNCSIKNEKIQLYKSGRTGITGKLKTIGIHKAKGELIAFIDSDDLWAPGKLEKQVAALEQYPEAGFCLTGGYNFKKTGESIDHFFKQAVGIKYGNIFLDCFKSEVHGFSQALLFRKECIEIAGRFKEEKNFSDIDFIISLAQHFNAIILYEPLVYRRLHNSNYIHSTWTKSYYEGIKIIEDNKDSPTFCFKKCFIQAIHKFWRKVSSI